MSDQEIQPGVIVLGMHRSGTSAVTQLLEALGLFVGEDHDLKEKSWQNPHGFFERLDIREISNALLESAEADWWKIRTFRADKIPDNVLEDQVFALRSVLTELSRHGRWVLKEPRLCFLLPVFLRVIERPLIVFVYRNPVEVAKSLRRRNGIPTAAGAVLWQLHNIAALRGSKGLDRIMLGYDDLVAKPEETTARLAGAIADWSGAATADPAAAMATIDPELRREKAGAELTASMLTDEQRALWDALQSGKVDELASLSERTLQVLKEFEHDEADRRAKEERVLVLERELERRGKDLKTQRGRVADLRQRLKEAEGTPGPSPDKTVPGANNGSVEMASPASAAQNASLTTQLAARDQEIEQLRPLAESNEDALAAIQAESEALAETLGERDGRIDELGQLGEAREREWRRLLDERHHQITALTGKMAHRDLEITESRAAAAEAQAGRAEVERRLERMLRSASWRVTAPIRATSSLGRAVFDRLLRREVPPAAPPQAKPTANVDPPPDSDVDIALFATPAIRRGARGLGPIAVFAAIADDDDGAQEPKVIDPQADYLLFTGGKVPNGSVWKTRRFDFIEADPVRTCLYVKTHPHIYFPGHEWSMWVDRDLQIAALPENFIAEDNEDCDVIAGRHPDRDCVYDEFTEAIAVKQDDLAPMQVQIERLRASGYPEHNGLIASGIMLFRHRRPAVAALLNDWWRLIDNGSPNDQLSFNPALALHPEIVMGYLGANGADTRYDPRVVHSTHSQAGEGTVTR